MVTLSSLISHTGEMGVPFLAVFADHTAVIMLILSEEALWVVVAVNVDLGQSIVCCGLHTPFMDTGFQPWQQQLQSVTTQSVH